VIENKGSSAGWKLRVTDEVNDGYGEKQRLDTEETSD
jgi:hypothetical protein